MTKGVVMLALALALLAAAVLPAAGVGGEFEGFAYPDPQTPVRETLRPGAVIRDCPDCPELVVIPPGRFQMGAPAGEEVAEGIPQQYQGKAVPQHVVSIDDALAVGRYAVTRREFSVFVAETGRGLSGCTVFDGSKFVQDSSKSWQNPGFDQSDRHPVVCVSWEDAQAYVRWLSQRTGKSYRLPSEAEWEYATRAGTTTWRYWGDDSSHTQQCGFANGRDQAEARRYNLNTSQVAQCDDGNVNTSPVGSFRPNAFGLYDMLGNVWQWTEDCWHENYHGAPGSGAWTTGSCDVRVVRGGSWNSIPGGVRTASRNGVAPGNRVNGNGLRVTRTVSP